MIADYIRTHNNALQYPTGPEIPLVYMRESISQFIRRQEILGAGELEDPWRDAILGPAVGKMLAGFRALLNGDLGRLDPSLLGQWISETAERIGYDLDTETYVG